MLLSGVYLYTIKVIGLNTNVLISKMSLAKYTYIQSNTLFMAVIINEQLSVSALMAYRGVGVGRPEMITRLINQRDFTLFFYTDAIAPQNALA